MPRGISVDIRSVVILLALLAAGCHVRKNYVMTDGPRYVGMAPPHIEPPRLSDTLRVVSFNIKYALQVDSALTVLRSEPELQRPDILLLQEMDAVATRYIARELGMWFVYYPATLHPKHHRDFGNAVLSRWPIIQDKKIVLPHPARFIGTARGATGATIQVGDTEIRVYSTHLGTYANISRAQRRAQLRAVLEDAKSFPRVVLGGDMNDPTVGELARAEGYDWPTEREERTALIGRLDHIFLKGLFTADSAGSGTVLNVRNASDHRPIWTLALLRKNHEP
jgi:endonuclease/exonuclease/phosphatase family metal-dependent hydrolase